MTAFARVSEEGEWGRATWELRTVNHRYLDITVRLPESLRDMEMAARELVQQYCSRGKLECFCRFELGLNAGANVALNEKLIEQLAGFCLQVKSKIAGTGDIDPMKLLMWPGAVAMGEVDLKPIQEKVIGVLKKALLSLVEARIREGKKLQDYLLQRVNRLHEHVNYLKICIPAVIKEQREKMKLRFAELQLEIDPQRLEQEMVFLIQKMDVSEELDRLTSHLSEVERVLQEDSVGGRRLDFLMQELNRETNTLGSKSSDVDITKRMVDMKVLIEQMREQVQNLE
jgi:uncharacterized protein (TIGR00255 family)